MIVGLLIALAVIVVIIVFVFPPAAKMAGSPHPLPWHPYIGNALYLLAHNEHPNQMLWEYTKKMEEKSFAFSMPGRRFLYIASPEEVEYVLKTNFENYVKGDFFRDMFKELLGNGLFAADGKDWHSQRKASSHMFSLRRLKDHAMKAFTEKAGTLIKQLDNKAESGEEFDMQAFYFAYTFDAFSDIAFGQQANALTAPAGKPHPFPKAFDVINKICSKRVLVPPPVWKLFRLLKLGEESIIPAYAHDLNDNVDAVIQSRLGEKPLEDSEQRGADLLGLYLEAFNKKNETPSAKELRDVVLNFIIAGRDTTAWTMTAITHMLMTHPEEMTKVKEELDAMYDAKEEEDMVPGYKELDQLPYLEAVMLETLRLYPSVPSQFKFALQNDTLPTGHKVSKDDQIVYSSYAMGRMTSIWGPDAQQFKPQRWVGVPVTSVPESKYPVFNVGKRNCLGRPMAILETKLLLATVLRCFDMTLSAGHDEEYMMGATLSFKHGMNVTLKKRNK